MFPDSALSTLFTGYFAYTGESLWSDDDEAPPQVDDPVDTVLVCHLTEAFPCLNRVLLKLQNASVKLSDTILGNRLAADVYLAEQDYENAIKSSKHGLRSLKQFEDESGKTLQRCVLSFLFCYCD